eukprot:jgi/Mesen1/6973/ME000361S06118
MVSANRMEDSSGNAIAIGAQRSQQLRSPGEKRRWWTKKEDYELRKFCKLHEPGLGKSDWHSPIFQESHPCLYNRGPIACFGRWRRLGGQGKGKRRMRQPLGVDSEHEDDGDEEEEMCASDAEEESSSHKLKTPDDDSKYNINVGVSDSEQDQSEEETSKDSAAATAHGVQTRHRALKFKVEELKDKLARSEHAKGKANTLCKMVNLEIYAKEKSLKETRLALEEEKAERAQDSKIYRASLQKKQDALIEANARAKESNLHKEKELLETKRLQLEEELKKEKELVLVLRTREEKREEEARQWWTERLELEHDLLVARAGCEALKKGLEAEKLKSILR